MPAPGQETQAGAARCTSLAQVGLPAGAAFQRVSAAVLRGSEGQKNPLYRCSAAASASSCRFRRSCSEIPPSPAVSEGWFVAASQFAGGNSAGLQFGCWYSGRSG